MNLGVVYFFAGNLDAAESHLKSTLEIEPSFAPAHWYLSRFYWQKDNFKEAFTEIETALRLSGDEPLANQIKQKADSVTPEKTNRFWFAEWRRGVPDNGIISHDLAVVAARLGDRAEALSWLEKSVAEKHPWSAMIAAEPEFSFLRDEPRFQKILRQINLPQ